MRALNRLKDWAQRLQVETYALSLAYRNPKTPWYAKAWGALVLAYAFSPIDLIPDFIPVLGYLDDLVLIPLGIAIAVRLIPAQVLAESREKAREMLGRPRPVNWIAGGIIIALWAAIAGAIISVVLRAIARLRR